MGTQQLVAQDEQFIKESILCKSLSGLEVPMLTVTSRINTPDYLEIKESEIGQEIEMPLNKQKRFIIVNSRVHPGEANASFMMEGFLRMITSATSMEAIELRKRYIFKIIPICNPDGVIIGNYRTSLAGNDLNRQYLMPNPKLHPTVCAIKDLIRQI